MPSYKLKVQISEFSPMHNTGPGIEVSDDISDCDVLFGVKEVPVDFLIPDKSYFFFAYDKEALQQAITTGNS
jgi:hypothetical protein